MNSQRAMFVSGAILGIGIGLGAGHFAFRPAVPPAPPLQELVFNPGTPFEYRLGERSASIPGISGPFFVEDEDSLQAGELAPSPLRNALALRTSEERPEHTAPRQASEEIAPEGIQEPQTLPLGTAMPLSRAAESHEQTVRGIIDLELSHLTQQQRDVWFDALRDVNKEDVAGILRMWKMFGGPVPSFPGGTAAPPAAVSGPAASPVTWRQLVDEARTIHLHNMRMSATPGYVPRRPYFTGLNAPGTPDGVRVATLLDFDRTRAVPTGFPLDLAVHGTGFLVLKDPSGQLKYARYGRFMLDENRRIVLQIEKQALVLDPEIALPGESGFITINSQGVVLSKAAEEVAPRECGRIRLAFPQSAEILKAGPQGLFEIDPAHASQIILSEPGPANGARILQGHIHLPAVNIPDELQAIDSLEQMTDRP